MNHTNNKWYSRGTNNTWTLESDYDTIDPGGTSNTISKELKDKLDPIKTALTSANDKGYTPLGYILKLDYVPKQTGTGNNIKYVTGNNPTPANRVITVTKEVGDDTKVPRDYIRYDHKVGNGTNPFKLGSVKYNDIPLNGIPETTGVTAVYVYYKSEDTKFEFPLIVCVKTSKPSQTYYTRGQTWNEDPSITDDPDSNTAGRSGGTLESKLNILKNIHEIRLEKTEAESGYKSSAEGTTQITVEKKIADAQKVPTGYVAYEHNPDTTITATTFKFNGVELVGLPESGVTIDSTKKLWVYYKEVSAGQPDIDKPLLIYVKQTTDKWYHRGIPWKQATDVTGNPNDSSTTRTGLKTKLDNYIRHLTLLD